MRLHSLIFSSRPEFRLQGFAILILTLCLCGCASVTDSYRSQAREITQQSILKHSSDIMRIDFSLDGMPVDDTGNAWNEYWLFGDSSIEVIQMHNYLKGFVYESRYSLVDTIKYSDIEKIDYRVVRAGYGTLPVIDVFVRRSAIPKKLAVNGMVEIDNGVCGESLYWKNTVDDQTVIEHVVKRIRAKMN